MQLVSASQAKNLKGRPKTDRLDAMWLARLAEMGLLRPSFVPPPEIRAVCCSRCSSLTFPASTGWVGRRGPDVHEL